MQINTQTMRTAAIGAMTTVIVAVTLCTTMYATSRVRPARMTYSNTIEDIHSYYKVVSSSR